MKRAPHLVFLAETLVWVPLWLLPWLVRLITHQRHDASEPWVSLFLCLLLPYLASRFGRFEQMCRGVLLIFLSLGCLISTGLAVTHFGLPSPSNMLVVLNTNPSETGEFFEHFISTSDIALLLLVFVPWCVFLIQRKFDLFWRPKPQFAIWLAIYFLVHTTAHGGFSRLFRSGAGSKLGIETNEFSKVYPLTWYPPLKPYVQLVQAVRIRIQIKKTIASSNTIENVVQLEPAKGRRTYVVIIGESMARSHMSLYGYKRPTTPGLSELQSKGELFVYQNVISTQAQTGAALMDTFIWKPSPDAKASTIIDLFNSVGFQTYWISNQPGLGVFDNLAALLTHRARHHMWMRHSLSTKDDRLQGVEVFMNTRGWAYDPNERIRDNFDESLIPVLAKLLRDPAEDKMLFVHLMGNHANYRARFPQSFEFFDSPIKASGRTPEQYQTINDYDNSLRYTDSVICRMIDEVKKIGGESYVLYFSDHGEEVHDWRVCAAHSSEMPSPLMLEIPFILWLSEDFKMHHPELTAFLSTTKSRPFSMMNFPSSLAHLSRLSHQGLPERNSLFSKNYQTTPRQAVGLDFEAFDKSWRPDAEHAHGMDLLPVNSDVPRLMQSSH